MACGPQRLALVARIGRSGRRLFDRFEIQHQPAVGRQRAELRKVGQPDDPFVRGDASGQVLFVPAGTDDQLLRAVVHARYRVVPLPRVVAHQRRIGLQRVLEQVVEDQQVHRVAGERSFAPDREQAAALPGEVELLGGADQISGPGGGRGGSLFFVSGTSVQRFEPGVREKFCVGSAVDQLLDAAVKARREPQVVRRERDAQAGADAQRIGGQQHRRAERLAVLRRYRDDQPPDEPFGKGVQGTVIGGVERCRAEAGNAPSREVRQAAPRQFALDCPARDCQPGPGIGNGMQVYSGGRTGARGRSSARGGIREGLAGAGRLRGVCGKGFVHRAGRGWS